MKTLFIYSISLWPVFTLLFIHFTRKIQSIDVGDLLAMLATALIPFFREVILVSLVAPQIDFGKPIFKKYTK